MIDKYGNWESRTKSKTPLVSESDLIASLCLESFEDFVKEFWEEVPGAQTLAWNWHMAVLCQELQDVAERVFLGQPKEHDCVFNISPGTSKSTLCSILFPAWCWARMPRIRILTASHADDLVLDLANKARHVIKGEKYQTCFSHVRISDEQDTKGYYANTHGGDRKTCTVGGKSPMGFHAHLILIDDPIDPKKAVSELELRTASEFMTGIIPSRKIDKEVSVTFLVMQRLHRNDPTGVMLEKSKLENAPKVKQICLPASTEFPVLPIELKERYVNGLMDPIRLSDKALKEQRALLGEYSFSAQFGQSPRAANAGMFEEHYFNNRVKAAPYDCKRIRYWDRACLIASTLINTSDGLKPIESIRPGDFVLTRYGYKEVEWAGQTKVVNDLVSVHFANGSVITGTGDHLVWTENNGWVQLDTLGGGDYVIVSTTQEERSWKQDGDASQQMILKPSSSMELDILDDQANATSKQITGARRSVNTTQTPCIELSGDFTTVTFPVVMTYTTRTKTGTTTRSITWSACPKVSTRKNTVIRCDVPQSRWRRHIKDLQSGLRKTVGQRSSRNNASEEVRQHLPRPRLLSTSAFSVGRNTLKRYVVVKQRSPCVANRASTNIAKRRMDILVKECALGVESHSWGGREQDAVPLAVEQNGPGSIPVFDLTVKDNHEFFANGILVHNSTSDGGCLTAGVLLAKDREGHFYVEHVVTGQWATKERNERMRAIALRDRARYGPHCEPIIYTEREGGSSGRDAWREVARALAGFVVREDRVTGDKVTRAEPWSAQLASGNVFLVEDGTWDLNAYIQEHCLFPDSTFKDRVDSSSGGFNLLVGWKRMATLHTLPIRRKDKKPTLKVVVCSIDYLPSLELKGRELLISVRNPGEGKTSLQEDIKEKLLGTLDLIFADMNPADYQQEWEKEVPAYGQKPEELIMCRDDGKKLWGFILKKRDKPVEEIILLEDKGKRALSLAYGICDVLKVPRDQVECCGDIEDNKKEDTNPHIYALCKSTRGMVV